MAKQAVHVRTCERERKECVSASCAQVRAEPLSHEVDEL